MHIRLRGPPSRSAELPTPPPAAATGHLLPQLAQLCERMACVAAEAVCLVQRQLQAPRVAVCAASAAALQVSAAAAARAWPREAGWAGATDCKVWHEGGLWPEEVREHSVGAPWAKTAGCSANTWAYEHTMRARSGRPASGSALPTCAMRRRLPDGRSSHCRVQCWREGRAWERVAVDGEDLLRGGQHLQKAEAPAAA